MISNYYTTDLYFLEFGNSLVFKAPIHPPVIIRLGKEDFEDSEVQIKKKHLERVNLVKVFAHFNRNLFFFS